ncbi:armadillo-type protein [Lipomyces japonicus]|uniref:armadillo-type protein n=1 Tax=Lipomyces japonicus TaxID=56871 RepID=UPI0034CD9D35
MFNLNLKTKKSKTLDIESENEEFDQDLGSASGTEFNSEDEDDDEAFQGFDNESDADDIDDHEDEKDDEVATKPKRENPYLPPVAVETPGKYIPPSLRKKQLAANDDSEELKRLRRQCQGLINRLSEANVSTISIELQQLFLNNPRQNMISTISSLILSMTAQSAVLLDSFSLVYAALIASLYKQVGLDFGASFVQQLVEDFDSYYKEDSSEKKCSNLMVLLSHLYTFQVVGCLLVYDFIRLFLKDVSELNTELLLKLIQNTGSQLRHDDPSALKDIILQLQEAVKKIPAQNLNSRTKFLIETVTSWKNNRLKVNSSITAESINRLKKYLGNLPKSTEPLRVTLQDIRQVENKGKWWLVGAAWSGGDIGRDHKQADVDAVAVKDLIDTAAPDWLALAKQQRMNTDIRRAVFIAIMGSEDYVDANERLMRLKLKRVQEREIPRVLLHCCANEKDFNPFYAYVATELCKQHPIRKTFQFALWDYFKEVNGSNDDEDSESEDDESEVEDLRFVVEEQDEVTKSRRQANFAKFFAILVGEQSLGLDLLKNINFLTCTPGMYEFLRTFLIFLFQHIQTRSARQRDPLAGEKALIQIIIKIKDNTILLKGLEFFLTTRMKSDKSKKQSKESRAAQEWGIKISRDTIQRLWNATEY